MPSPIGHSLAAIASGWSMARPRRAERDLILQTAVFCAIGVAPDLDLLWGRHSQETHSLGAALLAGLATFVLARVLEVRTNPGRSYERSAFARTLGVRTNLGAAILVAAVWLVHPLMDALGEDSSPPFGVMLWWPFSHASVIAPFHVFDSIYRAYWKPDFWSHNAAAAAREIVILAPILTAAWLWRRRARAQV